MSPPASSTAEDSETSLTPPSIDDDSTVQLVFTGTGWEEPHPGSRLSYSSDASARWCVKTDGADTNCTDGGCSRGAMAAKGDFPYDYYPNTNRRPWLVRRDVRTRARHQLPKPLSISNQGSCEGPDMRSAPLPPTTTGDILNSPPAPAVNIGVSAIDSAKRSLEVDIDGETEAGTDGDQSTIRGESSSISSPLNFTDFSNHLGIHMYRDDGDDASITVVDSDAFSHMSPDSDLYGWDAELDRKSQLDCQTTDGHDYSRYGNLHYRRANGGKRSLLHRVLSIGTMPPRPPDAGRIPPTSFAMRTGNLI